MSAALRRYTMTARFFLFLHIEQKQCCSQDSEYYYISEIYKNIQLKFSHFSTFNCANIGIFQYIKVALTLILMYMQQIEVVFA